MRSGRNPKHRKKILEVTTFLYKTKGKITLPKPVFKDRVSFFDVLENRRSTKIFTEIKLNQIGGLLWHSAKVRQVSVSKEGLIRTKTNSPSAGALHPIDIFVTFFSNSERCFYYYNPFDHSLENLLIDFKLFEDFLNHVNQSVEIKNGCLLWFGADLNRTKAVYKNPESLLWRDAGALLMTVQLVAQALRLHSCPLGTLGEPYFSQLFNSYKLQSAGGIIIG
jgi:SagB-type dehydrogenase family enzyme